MAKNCQKIPKNYQNDPKMAENDLKWPKKWPKIVLNVQPNSPNEASNTNTKFPN